MIHVSESQGFAGLDLFHLRFFPSRISGMSRPGINARWTIDTVGKGTFPTVLSVRKMDTH